MGLPGPSKACNYINQQRAITHRYKRNTQVYKNVRALIINPNRHQKVDSYKIIRTNYEKEITSVNTTNSPKQRKKQV